MTAPPPTTDADNNITDDPPIDAIEIFDGHNDLLYQLWRRSHSLESDKSGMSFFAAAENTDLAITEQKARDGHLTGGLFAIFVPHDPNQKHAQKYALGATQQMLQIAHRMASHPSRRFHICRTHQDIAQARSNNALAVFLHLEGAESIGPDLDACAQLYAQGIRSIGPLWSRPNIFGVGVPFSFPGSPDIGSGLTDYGVALVRACDDLGMMLDVSHLNEAGFWDIAVHSSQPLTATHSNAHALCPSPRNLTDRQLSAIAESGGIVGACFATSYLRSDGSRNPNTAIDLILRQLDYLVSHLGESHVGLGSDFDGAVLPTALSDCSCLPYLVSSMLRYGFGPTLTAKICSQNWHHRLSQLTPPPNQKEPCLSPYVPR